MTLENICLDYYKFYLKTAGFTSIYVVISYICLDYYKFYHKTAGFTSM
jgi:hypothetical protein